MFEFRHLCSLASSMCSRIVMHYLFLPLQVFYLMESIELIARCYLNVNTFTPDTDLRTRILEEVHQSESVLSYWEMIACSIPSRYELYSIELLKAITTLWISICGHSFAKEWTMKFERSKYQKGTRKTLSQRNK